MSDFSTTQQPEIIAHRGSSGLWPENSLPAFRAAWEEGAAGIECDLQLTSDGQIVAFHDDNALRICGDSRRISEISLAELKTLDAGSWKGATFANTRVATLAEILADTPPGGQLVLELKTGIPLVHAIEKAWPALVETDVRPTLISFDYDVIRVARERLPDVQALWIFSDYDKFPPDVIATELIHRVRSARLDGVDLGFHKTLFPQILPQLMEARLRVFAYTINTLDAFKICQSNGVHAITTDFPARFVSPE